MNSMLVLILLFIFAGLLPLIALIHLFLKKKKKFATKFLLFCLIVFVPFGWLIYWIIHKKVR